MAQLNSLIVNGCSRLLAKTYFNDSINSSISTGSYIMGNRGKSIINSSAAPGSYVMLAKMNSTNGYFTQGIYQGNYLLQYTAKSTVDAETNSVTKSVTLLNEAGNTTFPGTVTATAFSGNASSATKLATARNIGNASFNGTANITLAQIGAAASSHTHTKSQITDFPTSLKNPAALTISLNGTSQGAYDGSTAKSFNVTAASIGAAATSHTHNYAGSSSSGGAANSATKLVTARKIGTASFDGTADISLGEYTVSIPVSAWSSAYPFTATVSVSGIKAAKNYVMSKSNYSTKTLADVKTYEKNIGYIFWAEPADGSVKFYAKKKPTIDFTIQLKEVL